MVNIAVARVMVGFVERSGQRPHPTEEQPLDHPTQHGLWVWMHGAAAAAWLALAAALRPDVGPIV